MNYHSRIGLYTVGMRPRSDIKMVGSVSEDSTSLELDFTEDNGCKKNCDLISWADNNILHTYNVK